MATKPKVNQGRLSPFRSIRNVRMVSWIGISLLLAAQHFDLKPIEQKTALLALSRGAPAPGATAATPTFYGDVLPILEQHCQSCHRAGAIGPMSLVTYEQT